MASVDNILDRTWPRWPALGIVVTTVLLVFGILAHQLILPRVLKHALDRSIPTAEADTTADLSVGAADTDGINGIQLKDLRISLHRDGESRTVVRIPSVRVTLRLSQLLRGSAALRTVDVNDAVFRMHRRSDGTTTLSLFSRRANGGEQTAGDGDTEVTRKNVFRRQIEQITDRALSWFGGEYPAVDASFAIGFTAASEAKSWRLKRIDVPALRIEPSEQSASVSAKADFEPNDDQSLPSRISEFKWPESATLTAKLRRPIWSSTGRLSLSSAARLSGVGPGNRLTTSVEALFVEPGPTFGIEGLAAKYRTSTSMVPLGSLDSFSLEWPDLAETGGLPDIHRVSASGATIHLRYRGIGRSAWHDLLELQRRSSARHVIDEAESIAENMAESRDNESGDRGVRARTELADSHSESSSLFNLDLAFWAEVVPEIIELRGIEVDLRDERALPVRPFSPHLSLEEGRLSAGLHPDRGAVSLKVSFDALDHAPGDGEKKSPRERGSVEMTLAAENWGDEISIDTDVSRLSVPWLAQMLGHRVADTLREGTLSADISSSSSAESSKHRFSGSLAAIGLTIQHPNLAKEPIESIDGRYTFEGYWNPDEMPPVPSLLPKRADSYREKNGLAKHPVSTNPQAGTPPAERQPASSNKETDTGTTDTGAGSGSGGDRPVRDGVLHFSKGNVTLQGLEASFRPQLSGVSMSARPSRLDLSVEIPDTRIQTMIDAVPDAILGPLEGMQFRGSFGWSFRTEIPLFEAGEMKWRSEPRVRGVQLVHLPREVDVRDLTGNFHHTIHNPDETYQRSVRVPEMKPTPAPWLLANAELTLEEIDERRRDRDWPPVPSESELPAILPTYTPPEPLKRRRSYVVTEERTKRLRERWRKLPRRKRPEVWLTDAATSRTAEPPWNDRKPLWFLPAERLRRWRDERLPELIETFRSRARSTTPAIQFSHPNAGMQLSRPSSDDGATWDELQEFLGTSPQETDKGMKKDSPSGLSAGWFRARELPTELVPSAIGRFGKPTNRKLRLNPYGPYHYVPLHHISKWMTRAIMTFEDNSFFEHNGFNWHAIQESVEDNLKARGFVRGASTISMQLVKNLYLTFDKVLARKLREVFLVWVMESVVDVPKSRILEIYFNIIEFGPGVFGIHDAAMHYFGIRPDELTLMQTVWLVSIIPNPPKHHQQWERGRITRGWADNLRAYVDIMYDRDRLSEKTKDQAVKQIPEFFKPDLRGIPLRAMPSDDPPDKID